MKHLQSISENKQFDLNQIKSFMSKNSYLDLEDDSDTLLYTTRNNGDVGSETYGQKDYQEAQRIKRKLISTFDDIIVKVEDVDEWIHLTITKLEKVEDEYTYTFKKDLDGAGFSDGFRSMEALIDKYGSWIKVNWKSIIDKVSKIDSFPENSFTGWHISRPLLIAKAGDKGNDWGYNFYILKNKKNK